MGKRRRQCSDRYIHTAQEREEGKREEQEEVFVCVRGGMEEEEDADLYGDVIAAHTGTVQADAHGDTRGEIVDDKTKTGVAAEAGTGVREHESRVTLEKRLAEMEDELKRMREERVVLVRNMSCIFKTAKEEIARKDAIIDDLRRKAFAVPRREQRG